MLTPTTLPFVIVVFGLALTALPALCHANRRIFLKLNINRIGRVIIFHNFPYSYVFSVTRCIACSASEYNQPKNNSARQKPGKCLNYAFIHCCSF